MMQLELNATFEKVFEGISDSIFTREVSTIAKSKEAKVAFNEQEAEVAFIFNNTDSDPIKKQPKGSHSIWKFCCASIVCFTCSFLLIFLLANHIKKNEYK